MAHVTIDNSEVPIRLFKSDFMEFFTHIHPAVIVVIWLPVILYFLVSAILDRAVGVSPWYIPAGFVIGILVWSFTEYTMHRYVFHFKPRNEWQARVVFLFHGIHHLQPQDKTRLVMPPIVSIPLALTFYGLFNLVLGTLLGRAFLIFPMFAGFGAGYLAYDMIHYATHHYPMRWGPLKYLKRYHMMHHYKTPDERFGVTSPFWDVIFETKPD